MEIIPGRLVGAVIETPASRLEWQAKAALENWFANPGSLECKRKYGYALLDWAKETKNSRAKKQAQSLLREENSND